MDQVGQHGAVVALELVVVEADRAYHRDRAAPRMRVLRRLALRLSAWYAYSLLEEKTSPKLPQDLYKPH